MKLPLPFVFARAAGRSGRSASAWRHYFVWRKSLRADATPLAEQRPWMTFEAAEHLERWVDPRMRVFEWGVGGSTAFLAQRVANLVSVEHEPTWANQTKNAIGARPNWQLELVEPELSEAESDPSDPASYASSDPRLRGRSFRPYAAVIDRYPDRWFDLVIVDGRARPSCLVHAIQKVRPGGWLLLDDAERPHYQEAVRRFDGSRWSRRDFFGPGPYKGDFWLTTLWRREP